MRLFLATLILVLCVSTTHAQKDPTKTPVSPPEMMTFNSVNPKTGHWLVTKTRYRLVTRSRVVQKRVGNRIVQETITEQVKVPFQFSTYVSIAGLTVCDFKGNQIKAKELTPRLKRGTQLALTNDAKRTSTKFAKMLSKSTLILVDPKWKPMPPTKPSTKPKPPASPRP